MEGTPRRTLKRQFQNEISKIEKHFRVVQELQNYAPDTNVSPTTSAQALQLSQRSLQEHESSKLDSEESSMSPSQNEEQERHSSSEGEIFEYGEISSSDSESECNLESGENDIFDREFLSKWAIDNAITHKALSDLLKGMRNHSCFSGLPRDARTLLKTPRRTVSRIVPPGSYTHFGLVNKIAELAEGGVFDCSLPVKLQFNVDGLPLYKSSRMEFWPILGYVSRTEIPPFVIGLYAGEGKPSSVSQFLEEFIIELKCVLREGVTLKSGDNVSVSIDGFVCDAPARAFISCINSHTGYYACGKCTVKGKYVENRVVYPYNNSPLRTNDQFRNEKEKFEEHHNGISPLEDLQMDMIKDIPYEYMHLVCLGVMRKMILLWMRGKHKLYKISSLQVEQISKNLISFVPHFPHEFGRKPRSLREIDRWKATELRQFLLYTGPLAIKDIVDDQHYNHFMSLHVAIRILTSDTLHLKYNSYADSLLKYFVQCFGEQFGEETVSYNVHGLLHLASDSERFGPLDNFSAFRFENKLGALKRLIRKSSSQLEQIHRRLTEQEHLKSNSDLKTHFNSEFKPVLFGSHSNGPVSSEQNCLQYKKCRFRNFTLCVKEGNNSVLLNDGSAFCVRNIIADSVTEQISIVGHKLKYIRPLYEIPCNSSLLSTFYVRADEHQLHTIKSDLILRKGVLLPSKVKGLLLFIPLIHRE